MVTTALTPILGQARAHLLALRSRAEGSPDNPLLENFLLDMYHIGLAIVGETELMNSPELRAFLDETAPELMEEHIVLHFYPGNLVREFLGTWEYNEWEKLCQRRSAFQFFMDIYRETELALFIQEIETDYLDEEMRDWGNHEGFLASSAIDPRTPRSHWWWWAPELTPSQTGDSLA
jgi:hypothetical protein